MVSKYIRRLKWQAETTTIISLNQDIEANRPAMAVVGTEEAVTKRISELLLQSCPSACALSVLGRLCWQVLEAQVKKYSSAIVCAPQPCARTFWVSHATPFMRWYGQISSEVGFAPFRLRMSSFAHVCLFESISRI